MIQATKVFLGIQKRWPSSHQVVTAVTIDIIITIVIINIIVTIVTIATIVIIVVIEDTDSLPIVEHNYQLLNLEDFFLMTIIN